MAPVSKMLASMHSSLLVFREDDRVDYMNDAVARDGDIDLLHCPSWTPDSRAR